MIVANEEFRGKSNNEPNLPCIDKFKGKILNSCSATLIEQEIGCSKNQHTQASPGPCLRIAVAGHEQYLVVIL